MKITTTIPKRATSFIITRDIDLYEYFEARQKDNSYIWKTLLFRRYNEFNVKPFAKYYMTVAQPDITTPDWIIEDLYEALILYETKKIDEAIAVIEKQRDNLMKLICNINFRQDMIWRLQKTHTVYNRQGEQEELVWEKIEIMGEEITLEKILQTKEVTTWHFIEDWRPIKM